MENKNKTNRRLNPADLSEPYEENGKWCVDEQLYPECRGFIQHKFNAKGKALEVLYLK